ncbi:MAG: glycosyltransferase family 1 protein [Deinococcota bacterium]
MKIGLFTYGMDQHFTGIARYAVNLTRELVKLEPNLDITLLNPYPDSAHPWYQEFASLPMQNLRLVPLAASLGNWSLHRAARELKLDILHDPCGIAPFLLPPPGFPRRYKRVVTIHDAISLVTPEVQPLATRLIFQTLIPASGKTADGIITVSQAAADDLIKYAKLPADKITVTPNGVDAAMPLSDAEVANALAKLDITQPYILYVGNLAPRKNLARVIDAFDKVHAQHDVRLVIVGAKNWRADETFAKAGNLDSVIFPGYVDEPSLHALYYGAKMLAFPSLYEGFGLPALEAMVHGTPVIASTASSLPEIVGDAGILVDPLSVDAIADAMQHLLTDDAKARQLIELGYERAKMFSWEETARRTLELYKNLVS